MLPDERGVAVVSAANGGAEIHGDSLALVEAVGRLRRFSTDGEDR